MKNKKKNTKEKNKNKDTKKRIILIIIAIIIIILALLTSCSCTSKFFGKIGELFSNEGHYTIKEQEGSFCEDGFCEFITNKDLTFDTDSLKVSVSDENIKLSYRYKNISPQELTCYTSDANIATCYVHKDGYVVMNPKKEGKVTVTLQTKTNDKIYQATASITIASPTKSIRLSNYNGTINLRYGDAITVVYRLVGIKGEVKVTSSNEEVATATLKDNILKIYAKKTGKATITLTVEENGKTYTATYNLTVVNNPGTSSGGNTSDPGTNPNKPSTDNSNNYLSNLSTNRGMLTPAFNYGVNNYTINLSEKDKNITLIATPSNPKADVKYNFNGKETSDFKDIDIAPGTHNVTIVVTAPDGSTNKITVTITKPDSKPIEPEKDHNSTLDNLTTNKGTLSPAFTSGTKKYDVNVGASDTDIKLTADPAGKNATVTYTFNGNNYPDGIIKGLKPGANIVTVTVTAEDGSVSIYTVTVNRPSTYKIAFNEDSYECSYEAKTCYLKITVTKDGNPITDYNPSDIKISLPESYQGDAQVGTGDKLGYIIITPKTENMQPPVDLTLTYKESTAVTTINFKTEKYTVSSYSKEYDLTIDEENKTNSVIMNTNLFDYIGNKSEDVDVKIASDKKSITITSLKDPNVFLIVRVKEGNITIDYKPEGTISSIPVLVNATDSGTAKLEVIGSAYGTQAENSPLEITLKITKKYIVTLKAGEGIFNEFTTEYRYEIASNEQIDLSTIKEPIKVDKNNECKYYKFKGYAKEGTTDIIYTKDSIIKDLTSDITLVAIYEETIAEDNRPLNGELWLVDVPLFYNEEYFKKYGEDKVIYPGASGKYTMNFTNETGSDITFTGMVLEEDTICVDVDENTKGCLNMSYAIRTEFGDSIYGGEKDYWILHEHGINQNLIPPKYTYRDEIDFTNIPEENLTMKANSKEIFKITIRWEWTFHINDTEDRIDTAIGNQAAKKTTINSLNDLYKLKVGIRYKVNKVCSSE